LHSGATYHTDNVFRGRAATKLEEADMKKALSIGGVAITMLALTGCIHVSDDGHSDLDEIAINTETALRVCGGEGRVKEVTEDGYICHAN
jgi:hypothetical protein